MAGNASTAAGLIVGADSNNARIFLAVDASRTVLDVTSAPSMPVAKAIVIATAGDVLVGTTFRIAGSLTGYTVAPPVLTYADGGAAAQAFPSGSSITLIDFSFVHPTIATAGSYAVTVLDAANGISNTIAVTVTAMPTNSITINAIPAVSPNTPFQVTGTLSNYTTAPTLSRSDDGGTTTALPAGTVTTTNFSFTHPGMPAGSHTLKIQDAAGISNVATYTVTAATGNVVGVPLGTAAGGNLRRIQTFWDMFGMNIHVQDGPAGYGNVYNNASQTLALLNFLNPNGAGTGVFVMRDEVIEMSNDSNVNNYGQQFFNTLGGAGYKFIWYIGFGGGGNQLNTFGGQAAIWNGFNAKGYTWAFEGANECSHFNLTHYRNLAGTEYGSTDPDGTQHPDYFAGPAWQIDLWNTYHPQGYPILNFTLGNNENTSSSGSDPVIVRVRQQGYNAANYCDKGSCHFYTNAGGPAGGPPNTMDNFTPTSLDNNLNNQLASTGGQGGYPGTISEYGLTHSLDGALGAKAGTPTSQAKALPQAILDLAYRNFYWVAYYELVDRNLYGGGGGYEGFWGLWNYNGSAAYPAAISARWMAGITSEASGAVNSRTFFTGTFNPTVNGLSQYGHYLCYQNTLGDVFIWVWPNVQLCNYSGNTVTGDKSNSTFSVTVGFGAQYTNVTVYDLWTGAAGYAGTGWASTPATPPNPTVYTNVSQVVLNMSDYAMVIKIAHSA